MRETPVKTHWSSQFVVRAAPYTIVSAFISHQFYFIKYHNLYLTKVFLSEYNYHLSVFSLLNRTHFKPLIFSFPHHLNVICGLFLFLLFKTNLQIWISNRMLLLSVSLLLYTQMHHQHFIWLSWPNFFCTPEWLLPGIADFKALPNGIKRPASFHLGISNKALLVCYSECWLCLFSCIISKIILVILENLLSL